MNFKTNSTFLAFIFVFFSFSGIANSFGFDFFRKKDSKRDTSVYVSPFKEENEKCLSCHGQKVYEFTNSNTGLTLRDHMFSELIINRDKFYSSNHKSFKCTDCHSTDYENFPHAAELRMEPFYSCTDCHAGDEKYAQYHFETIEEEYNQSTHYKLEKEGFSCWKCHNPHSYHISIRNTENLNETILYDNKICLSCHANFDNFQLLTDREEINIMKTHDWLPNQANHFKSVRCIECHTQTNDSILVAHLIKPKDQAIRGCNECHSKNSLLLATLYKFQVKEQRKETGFVNGVMINDSYVIGANRNFYLNLTSILIFVFLLGVIAMHVVLRLIKTNKKEDVS